MSRLLDKIDFRELQSDIPGEGLEGLTRLLAEHMGLQAEWSGRGADRHKDLVITQVLTAPLHVTIRWLVNCKDFALTGRSVSEGDLHPNMRDKMDEHQTQGYLLVTTTTASTNAKESLDRNRRTEGGRYFTDVWDSAVLRNFLLIPKNEDLLKQYLPQSYARIRELEGPCADTPEQIVAQFERQSNVESREKLIPGLATPLPRAESGHIEDLLESGASVILAGEAGTGKSGIGYALCGPRKAPQMPVLFMDAQRFSNARNITELPHWIGLHDPIATSVGRLGERTGCRVIIDQLDSASGDAGGQVMIELALQCSRMPGVQVVVISRRRESYEHKLLNSLTDAQFQELECAELVEEDAKRVLERIGIPNASDDLVGLSRNLLNLSLVAQIKRKNTDYDFSSLTDTVALWEAYVQVLESSESNSSASGPAFGNEVISEAIRLAKEGLKSEDRTFCLSRDKSAAQRRLDSGRIIVPVEGYSYKFYHENLQDFLYAHDAASKGYMPEQVQDEIARHRLRTILPWMEKIYAHFKSPKYSEFLKKALNA